MPRVPASGQSFAQRPQVSDEDLLMSAATMHEQGRLVEPDEVEGLLEEGNIDLKNRPQVKNPDGKISTVRSIGVEIDGVEVVIPTVSDDGRLLSDEEAVKLYRQTGKHLGKFRDPKSASKYGRKLHEDQEEFYGLRNSR